MRFSSHNHSKHIQIQYFLKTFKDNSLYQKFAYIESRSQLALTNVPDMACKSMTTLLRHLLSDATVG